MNFELSIPRYTQYYFQGPTKLPTTFRNSLSLVPDNEPRDKLARTLDGFCQVSARVTSIELYLSTVKKQNPKPDGIHQIHGKVLTFIFVIRIHVFSAKRIWLAHAYKIKGNSLDQKLPPLPQSAGSFSKIAQVSIRF